MKEKLIQVTTEAGTVPYQVFFLPKSTALNSASKGIVAFCPFTGISAEGITRNEAASKWIKAAKGVVSGAFIPKYLIVRRKVLAHLPPVQHSEQATTMANNPGEIEKNVNSAPSAFFLDFSFTQQCALFLPETGVSSTDIRSEVTAHIAQAYPGTWIDWPVECTPIMRSRALEPLQTLSLSSLTPHYIN